MQDRTREIRTRDGLRLAVRRATIDDEDLLLDIFDHVSPQDLRFRFFSAMKHVSRKQIAELIGLDHSSVESYIAFIENTATPVATAVLASDYSKGRGEVAISVRNDYKGRGIGWELLALVARQAEQAGLSIIDSVEDRDNHGAIEVEQNMGFTTAAYPGDPRLLLLSKTLEPQHLGGR